MSLNLGGTATLSTTGSSGSGAVTYATTGPCSISGTQLATTGAGSCSVTATIAADSTYDTATSAPVVVTVSSKQSQTIDFPYPGGSAVGNGSYLVIKSSSKLSVVLASTTPSVCTVSGPSVSYIGAGTCTLTADQAGDATYSAAPQVTWNLPIDKGAQSISFTAPRTGAIGAINGTATLTATAPGGAVSFSSLDTTVCTVSGTTVTYIGVGICAVAANQAGSVNYNPAGQLIRTITVIKASQAISFTAPATGTFNGSASLSATAPGGAVSFASQTAGVCTVSDTTVTYIGVGTCTIAANQAGDANFSAAPQVTQAISVGKADQAISFSGPGTGTFNGTATLSATAPGGAVSFTSQTTGLCSVSGTTVTYIGVGTCTIAADQTGSANYNAAPQVTQSVSIGKGGQAISFTGPGTGVINGSATLTATAPGGTVSFTSQTTSVCTVSGANVSYIGLGTCTIAANQAGSASYNAAPQVTQSITVGKAAQTITFTGPGTGTFNGSATLTATAPGGTVTFTSQTTSVCTVSGANVTYIGAGTCTIAADQAGNATYSAAPQVTQNITVGKASQTIAFTAPSNATFGGSATLTATASSGLAVVFTSMTQGVCTVSASGSVYTVTYRGAADACILAADQPGNANYTAAPQFRQAVYVGVAATSVALTADATAPVLGAPVALRAVLSGAVSGTPMTGSVTFKDGATTIGTGQISGGVATLTISSLTLGAHSITAVYSGDTKYAASTSSAVSVTPYRPDPTKNAAVRSIVNNQVQTAQRIAGQQVSSVNMRLETLHEDNVPGFVNGIAMSSPETVRAYSPIDPLPYAQQGKHLPAAAALDKTAKPAASAPGKALGPDYYIWTAGAVVTALDKIDGLPDKTRTTSQSATVGIDTKLFEGFKAGVAFGGFASVGKIDDFGSKDRAHAFTGTLYASWNVGEGVFLDAALGYGGAQFKSSRYDSNATGLLTGTRNGDMVFGSLSASWDQKSGQLKYAPYARFDFSQTWLDKYAEQGDATWALAFDKTTVASQAAVLGLRGQYDIANGSGTVSPTVRVEYRHAFNGDATQTMSYVADPATVYGLSVAGAKRDTLTGALGLKAQGDGALSGQIEYLAGMAMQGGGFAGQGLRGSIRLGF